MKKNIKVALVFILIILNIIAGGFFIYLFFAIDSPSIYAEIDITGLTSKEIQLETLVDISNPNPFDLTLKNVNIVSETKDGDEFTRYSFKGGDVPSNAKKSFKSKDSIRLQGDIPKVLVNSITADVGIKFIGFIEKIIPIKAVIVLSVEDLINNISIPKIKIHGGIEEITEDGLILAGDIEISNPSNIELSVNDIFVELKTEDNNSVGSISLDGGTLEPKGTLNLDVSGIVNYEALNSKSVIIDVNGQATIYVAGLTHSLTISTSAVIDVPNLSDLLELNNDSFDFSLFGEFKIRLRGVITTVDFKVFNPSNIPLEAQDIKCIIYGITEDKKKVIVEKEMESCIVPSKNEVCISTQIRIPYLKLIFSGTGRILPEWFSIRLEGNFAINGTTQTIPISINGYIDPYIFR
jgi:LEA14-like dessication related protein